MSAPSKPRDWDAETYDRVSDPQVEWALELLDRTPLRGDEYVLDAGCGSGRVTRMLLERLPRGRVVAVDASPSMVEAARAALGPEVDVRVADLAALELEQPVDLVFSNAVFHWLPDHDRLFARLHAVLRPGGRLVAQAGGYGNVEGFQAIVREVSALEPFAAHVGGWRGPWNFRSAEDTAAALEHAGFEDAETWLEPKPVVLEEPREFIGAVRLGYHMDRLPAALRDEFLDRIVERVGAPATLHYVRLNISARRPG